MVLRATTALEGGRRHLLADSLGALHLLTLTPASAAGGGTAADDDVVMTTGGGPRLTMSLANVGTTATAAALAYLGGGALFVGSASSDSVLLRLEAGGNVTPLASYACIAPVVDMTVMDLDRQGQGQVVTASGVGRDGSLRIVRNGIGVEEQAVVELPGITGLWALRDGSSSGGDSGGGWDKYLATSYADETRILAMEGTALEEVDAAPGFDLRAPSLLCATLAGGLALQVTATAVLLADAAAGLAAVSAWSPAAHPATAGKRITVAAACGSQVLLALAGGLLAYLELDVATRTLACRATLAMPHEVSCLSMNPLATAAAAAAAAAEGGMEVDATPAGGAAAAAHMASLAAVGLWTDISVHLVALPVGGGSGSGMRDVASDALGGDIQSRSALLLSLEGVPYLFVALGDGHLFTYRVVQAAGGVALAERKKMALGSQPITLTPFGIKGGLAVFAACDRPTVLHAASRKLLLSNVNQAQVTYMAPFHTPALPDCLALASAAGLTIGTVDDIQKLHIRTVALGEQPRRICHHKASKAVVVAVEAAVAMPVPAGDAAATAAAAAAATAAAAAGAPPPPPLPVAATALIEKCFIRLFDETAFDALSSYALEPFEVTTAMMCAHLDAAPGSATAGAAAATAGDATEEYIVVGTAYVVEEEEEPTRGRVLVLRVGAGEGGPRSLQLVAAREVRGGVMALAPLDSSRFVGGVNSKVAVYEWRPPAGGAGGGGAGGGAAAGPLAPPPLPGDTPGPVPGARRRLTPGGGPRHAHGPAGARPHRRQAGGGGGGDVVQLDDGGGGAG